MSTPININPLTVWVPVKQDATSQEQVAALLTALAGGSLINSDNNLLYFARTVGVPNAGGSGTLGFLIITEFYGPMDQYLNFFYTQANIQMAFAGVYAVALNPPALPNNYQNFYNFITENNLSPAGSLSYAFTASVAQIVAKFPPQQ